MKGSFSAKLLTTLTAVLMSAIATDANAILIRSGGGSTQQDSFNETYRLYDLATLDYRASRVVSGTSIGGYSRNSLHFPAYATPPADCWDNIIRPDTGGEFHTDCHYEFYVGDLLELMGETDYEINGALYELNWHIAGMGHEWDYTSSDLSGAFLQTVMPPDMGPGAYDAWFTFTQIAPEGYTLFHYSNILDPYRCDMADNEDHTGEEMVCGQIGWLSESTSYTSWARILVFDRPISVPSPDALILLLSGFGVLLMRYRKQNR
ncbi:hypothetical protein HPT27_07045 [Permianibacter sp. IMCC34836]|uniref:hypothetical protein n=1 Tax=Permianibacter fluminis TaxID=2738515 RepID=UPI00155420F9|nr:hypothetical protein [Permianibacter fluminis]NQD36778.1 hypothetical protein [Permianibacter fluminis]